MAVGTRTVATITMTIVDSEWSSISLLDACWYSNFRLNSLSARMRRLTRSLCVSHTFCWTTTWLVCSLRGNFISSPSSGESLQLCVERFWRGDQAFVFVGLNEFMLSNGWFVFLLGFIVGLLCWHFVLFWLYSPPHLLQKRARMTVSEGGELSVSKLWFCLNDPVLEERTIFP